MAFDHGGLSGSEAEHQEISALENELRLGAWPEPATLQRELVRWERLASSLHVYRLTVDYTNDLYSRDCLQRALERFGVQ